MKDNRTDFKGYFRIVLDESDGIGGNCEITEVWLPNKVAKLRNIIFEKFTPVSLSKEQYKL
jgi:hypothetical protein